MDLQQLAADIASAYIPPDQPFPLPSPRTVGRPKVITEALIHQVASLVGEGHYIVTACRALGLGRTNYYRWCKQGEADDDAERDTAEAAFWHIVKTAEAQGEIRIGRKWQEGGKDWPAYATWNERRKPEHWAKRPESSDGPKVIVQIGVRDPDVQVQLSASWSTSDMPTGPSVVMSQVSEGHELQGADE